MAAARIIADYERPSLTEALSRGRALAHRLGAARDAEEAVAIVLSWNELRSSVYTQRTRAQVRHYQDTADAAAKAEWDFWDEGAADLREFDAVHARALTSCPQREAIAARFGPQLLRLKENTRTTFDQTIRPALSEEAKLTSQYLALISAKDVEFRGEQLSVAGIFKFFGHAQREVRLEARRAYEAFFLRHAARFDAMLDRLITLRDEMGKTLGLSGYVPLAYMLRERVGYGPAEVARFRASILRDVVPLCTRFFERHAARLGVSPLLLHDELVADAAGSPRPIAGSDAIIESARQMYHELHPACGAFMELMIDNDLLDVELREGKVPGGYCTFFADLGLPFVSGQFTGSEFDVHVLTHECGHAFQGHQAREQPLIEYIFPTGETSELFAMAMQLLTEPWMERFFGEAAPRYRVAQLERALTRLPLLALSDHFQHEIYEQPALGSRARHALWRELQQRYLPWRNYGDALPHLAESATWQVHHTIYTYPFYSMDYALAWLCALQIHERSLSDPEGALADYLTMCKAGGSVSFPEMLELGRLRSPFEPGTLPAVVAHLERALRL